MVVCGRCGEKKGGACFSGDGAGAQRAWRFARTPGAYRAAAAHAATATAPAWTLLRAQHASRLLREQHGFLLSLFRALGGAQRLRRALAHQPLTRHSLRAAAGGETRHDMAAGAALGWLDGASSLFIVDSAALGMQRRTFAWRL